MNKNNKQLFVYCPFCNVFLEPFHEICPYCEMPIQKDLFS